MRILIVQDDEHVAAFIAKGLRAEGYTTAVVRTDAAAEKELQAVGADIDLVLVDLWQSGSEGFDRVRRLRRTGSTVPVVVVTTRVEVPDEGRILDAGANDAIAKPFSFDELLARIRAALRTAEQAGSSRLEVDDLILDLVTKTALRAGRHIDLTRREWALLEMFMRHPHQVHSRPQILSSVWGYWFDPGSNVVDVYVRHLRRKLNRQDLRPLIQTVRGAGYRLVPVQ